MKRYATNYNPMSQYDMNYTPKGKPAPKYVDTKTITEVPSRVENTIYDGVTFRSCRLQNVEFVDCEFYHCDFIDCDMRGTKIYETQNIVGHTPKTADIAFVNCDLRGFRLEANIKYLRFDHIDNAADMAIISTTGNKFNVRIDRSQIFRVRFNSCNIVTLSLSQSWMKCTLTKCNIEDVDTQFLGRLIFKTYKSTVKSQDDIRNNRGYQVIG